MSVFGICIIFDQHTLLLERSNEPIRIGYEIRMSDDDLEKIALSRDGLVKILDALEDPLPVTKPHRIDVSSPQSDGMCRFSILSNTLFELEEYIPGDTLADFPRHYVSVCFDNESREALLQMRPIIDHFFSIVG